MVTKAIVQALVDALNEEDIEKVYRFIMVLAQSEQPNNKSTKYPSNKISLMSRLKNIQIEGPEDFAANIDLYLSGEKRIEELHPIVTEDVRREIERS